MASWTEYTAFLITLTAVLDPFFGVAVFLSTTSGRSDRYRRQLAGTVSLAVAAILLLSALFGEALLTLLGGSLASFRVGGGLVLLLMALAMLNAQPGGLRQTDAEAGELDSTGGGVVPLAIPLLAGPGAISIVIIAAQSGGVAHVSMIAACVLLVCGLLWAMLRLAARVGGRLGTTGLNVATRLLGLLLVAVSIETMATGLRQLFPVLAGS